MKTLELVEHQSRDFELEDGDVAELGQNRLGLKVEPLGNHWYRLRSSHYVGVAEHGQLRVRIRPKIPATNLLFLLGVAPEELSLADWQKARKSRDFVEVLGLLFLHSLESLLAFGLPVSYREQEEDLRSLRGRLDYTEIVTRRFGAIPPVPCRFDEISLDTEANRRILAALTSLAAYSGWDSETRGRLASAGQSLSDCVTSVRYGPDIEPLEQGDIPHIQLGHGASAFATVLSLSQIILERGSIEWERGSALSRAFVVDMDRVFEQFVHRILGASMGLEHPEWFAHPTVFIDTKGRFRGYPDIVWFSGRRRARLVVDAKWKSTEFGKAEDIKQVAMYCSLLGASDGVLVYAEAGQPSVHQISGSGVRVHVAPLNPGGTIAEVRARVRALAAHCWSLGMASSSSKSA